MTVLVGKADGMVVLVVILMENLVERQSLVLNMKYSVLNVKADVICHDH